MNISDTMDSEEEWETNIVAVLPSVIYQNFDYSNLFTYKIQYDNDLVESCKINVDESLREYHSLNEEIRKKSNDFMTLSNEIRIFKQNIEFISYHEIIDELTQQIETLKNKIKNDYYNENPDARIGDVTKAIDQNFDLIALNKQLKKYLNELTKCNAYKKIKDHKLKQEVIMDELYILAQPFNAVKAKLATNSQDYFYIFMKGYIASHNTYIEKCSKASISQIETAMKHNERMNDEDEIINDITKWFQNNRSCRSYLSKLNRVECFKEDLDKQIWENKFKEKYRIQYPPIVKSIRPSSSTIPSKPTSTAIPPKPASAVVPPKPVSTVIPPKPTSAVVPPKPSSVPVPPRPQSTQVIPPRPMSRRNDDEKLIPQEYSKLNIASTLPLPKIASTLQQPYKNTNKFDVLDDDEN